MNKWLLGLNVVLVFAVSFLLYHYFQAPSVKKPSVDLNTSLQENNNPFRIAYFEMDSVEEYFTFFKEVQKELTKKQDAKNNDLRSLYAKHQQKLEKLQMNSRSMTEEQINTSSQELAEIENEIKYSEKKWDQNINDYFMTHQQKILSMIRQFFEQYNKDRRYAYIVASEPGLFYYKDSACNVTSDLIKALNEMHKTAKK